MNELWDYLAEKESPQLADKITDKIFDAITRASVAPHRCRKTEFIGRPMRINVYRYSVFFDELDERDGIYIWRVLHGARDLAKLVKRPKR